MGLDPSSRGLGRFWEVVRASEQEPGPAVRVQVAVGDQTQFLGHAGHGVSSTGTRAETQSRAGYRA